MLDMSCDMVSNDGMASVPQMVNRSNSGHRNALRALRDGRPVCGPTARPSEVRGMRTVLATLDRWGCLDGAAVTDTGLALLEALERR